MSATISPVWSSRLAQWAGLILLLVAVWLLVSMLWLLMGGVEVEPGASIPVPREVRSMASEGDFRWSLFGDAAQRLPLQLQPVTHSDGRLRLKGLLAGQEGYAIIASNTEGEMVYRRGDELPGGGHIEAIEARRVLISRNGAREELLFDPDRNVSRSVSAGSNSAASRADLSSIAGFRGIDPGASAASTASLPVAVQALGVDTGRLANSISVLPVAGGGFRVRPGRDARLFSALGLQVNDVVMAVNGRGLDTPEGVEQLFGEVMSSGQVAITVRRGGREMTLRPDVETIMRQVQ